MKKLIHEIHRRSLWQVLGVYVVTGWVVLGAVGTLAESLNLPDWTPRFAFFLLIIGLPIVLATAFVQEGVGRGGATDVSSEDLETTAGGTPIPPAAAEPESTARQLFTWRNALVGGAAAFLVLFGFAGLYVVIQDRGRSFVPAEAVAIEADPGVAFLPFSLSGSALEEQNLREGVVTLLPMALDGITGIRPISSMTLWARWREHVPENTKPDLETALLVAEETGATYAVVGSGASIGSTVRLAAEVYDVPSRDGLGQVVVEGSPDSLLSLVDRFAVETIRTIGGISEGEFSKIDLGSVSTESPEALKEFIRGEASFRRADWTTALSHFERALDEDSTFGAAHHRAAMTLGWSPAVPNSDSIAHHHYEEALRYSTSERRAIAVRGLMIAERSPPADELDQSRRDLEAAVGRYPDDAELWNALAELNFHNHWRGMLENPLFEAERALTRATDLVPDAAPDRIHLVQLAFWRGDSAQSYERLEKFSRLAPGSEDDRVNRIMWRMIFGGPASTEQMEAAVDTLATLEPLSLQPIIQLYTAHPSAWPIAEALILRHKAKYPGFHDCRWYDRALGAGRLGYMLQEAYQADETWKTAWCLMQADFQGIEVSEVDSVLAVWNNPYWNAVHAADNEKWTDFAAAIKAQRDSASAYSAAGDSAAAFLWEIGAKVGEGYREWKEQGNPNRLLEILEEAPLDLRDDLDSRWWLGMLYLELDRPTDAIRMFETFWGWQRWPIAKYRIGEAYEQLGDTLSARMAYAEFVEAWKDADPELETWVQRGRDALARLGPLDQ